MSLFSPRVIPPSRTLFCLPASLSPQEAIPSWCPTSSFLQLPTPSFDLPPPTPALLPWAKGKEQRRGEESRGERLPGTGWGENGVSCTEEQMEGAVGDGA